MNIFQELMNDELNVAAEAVDKWIKMTDAVMDREVRAEHSLTAFEWGVKSISEINKHDGLWEVLEPHVLTLCIGARDDADYVPGRHTHEQDLKLWALKAGRLSVEFTFVCHEHPEIDTPDNWAWIKEAQEFGLKLNDCYDILSDRFEDMIQVRRNWFVMNMKDNDVFINWRDNIPKIKQVAKDRLPLLSLSKPTEQKLKSAYDLFIGQLTEMQSREV